MEEETVNFHLEKKDKVHLLRVPKGFDITKLNGVEYDPYQVLEIEAKQEKNGFVTVYELSALNGENMDLNLLMGSGGSIKAGPNLRQNLCVNKSIRVSVSATNSPMGKLPRPSTSSPVRFPEGLKQRFTPFGSGQVMSHGKKRKSKGKRKRLNFSLDDSDSFSPRKKRHKHKHREGDESINDILSTETDQSFSICVDRTGFIESDETERHHKKKKRKSNGSYSETEGSKHDTTQSLVNGNDCLTDEINTTYKKKKRRSRDNGAVPSGDDSFQVESDEVVFKEKRKKQKKIKKEKEYDV